MQPVGVAPELVRGALRVGGHVICELLSCQPTCQSPLKLGACVGGLGCLFWGVWGVGGSVSWIWWRRLLG